MAKDEIPTAPEAPPVIRSLPGEPLRPGQVVAGRYEIRDRLGEGGMGSVWRAHDRTLDKQVALKIILPERLGDPRALERFRHEVKIAQEITHPNVCRVNDLGEDKDLGLSFLTMELVEGSTLRQILAAGPLEPSRALDLFQQIIAGVAAVHAQGIVHRDLKPENVLVRRDGRAVVADFGVARDPRGLRVSAGLGGTPAYMSPEQLEGKPLDVRSDVFALGIIGYELLSGRMPFGGGFGEQPGAAILKHAPQALSAPGLPEPVRRDVQALLGRALARQAEARFASAAELGKALELVRGEARVRRRWVLPAAVILVALGTALGLLWLQRTAEERLVVVVPPFANLTGEMAWHGLTRSAAETLRAGLRSIPAVEITETPSPGTTALVMRGSVQRIGPRLRLLVQFVSPEPAAGVSSPVPVEVDTGPEDIPGALEALRLRTIDEVRLVARQQWRRRWALRGTASEVARARLLQFYAMTGPAPRPEHFEEGLRLLGEAIEADPRYVPALVERALLHGLGAGAGSAAEQMALANSDIEQARQVSPDEPEVAVTRCRLLQRSAELQPTDAAIDQAMKACREALLLDPSSSYVYRALGRLNDRLCQDEEALRALERAVELDRALSASVLKHLVGLTLDSGRVLHAERISGRLVAFWEEERQLGPRAVSRRVGAPEVKGIYLYRGAVLLKLGKLDEAKVAFELELKELATRKDAWAEAAAIRGLKRAVEGRDEPLLHELARRLDEIEARARTDSYLANNLAKAYRLVDPEAAARWLQVVDAPRTCDEAFLWAKIYRAAGQEPLARNALNACSSTKWERSCVEQFMFTAKPAR